MNKFEELLDEYDDKVSITFDKNMPKKLAGLYSSVRGILLNADLTQNKYHSVLAEEIGHYETTVGDIIDLTNIQNKKLEIIARRWGYKKIVTLDDLIECYEKYITTVEEICAHLEIVPEFLEECLVHYRQQYGQDIFYKDYLIILDPLDIKRKKDLAL